MLLAQEAGLETRDVHFVNTLSVPAALRHSREACPVLDTGAGIQRTNTT
jgi:hypothetical protein